MDKNNPTRTRVGTKGKHIMTEDIKKKISAGQYRRQSLYSNVEETIFMQDAKKDAFGRFTEIVKKYNLTQEDVEEILEISQFLL